MKNLILLSTLLLVLSETKADDLPRVRGWRFYYYSIFHTIELRADNELMKGVAFAYDGGYEGCFGTRYSGYGLYYSSSVNKQSIGVNYELYRGRMSTNYFGFIYVPFYGINSTYISNRNIDVKYLDLAPKIGFVSQLNGKIALRFKTEFCYSLRSVEFKGLNRFSMRMSIGLGINRYAIKHPK